jgi:protein TonB
MTMNPFSNAATASHKVVLGGFIVFSVVAHGLLLLLPQRQDYEELKLILSSPLQVTIVSSRPTDQADPEETAVYRAQVTTMSKQQVTTRIVSAPDVQDMRDEKPVKTGLPVPGTVAQTALPGNRKTTTAATPVDEVANIEESLAEPDEKQRSSRQSVINHLHRQLKEQITASFNYPRMARRMGWEGLVALSLRIEQDGSLNRVQVASSSGHRVLDDNARNTLQAIGRLNVATTQLLEAVDTRIDVLYRLTD